MKGQIFQPSPRACLGRLALAIAVLAALGAMEFRVDPLDGSALAEPAVPAPPEPAPAPELHKEEPEPTKEGPEPAKEEPEATKAKPDPFEALEPPKEELEPPNKEADPFKDAPEPRKEEAEPTKEDVEGPTGETDTRTGTASGPVRTSGPPTRQPRESDDSSPSDSTPTRPEGTNAKPPESPEPSPGSVAPSRSSAVVAGGESSANPADSGESSIDLSASSSPHEPARVLAEPRERSADPSNTTGYSGTTLLISSAVFALVVGVSAVGYVYLRKGGKPVTARTRVRRLAPAVDSPGRTAVFVSYRREDSADVAGRIYDRLREAFGRESVFKDVDSIPLGVDFREHLDERVARCDVFLAVIGDQWLTATDSAGRRRLEDPCDFVRIEVESAIKRGIPVIPVLVGNAAMPTEEEMPPGTREFVYRNGITVRPDPDFHNDLDRLISGIRAHAGSPAQGRGTAE